MKKIGILTIAISLAIHASAGWSPIGFGIVGVDGWQFPSPDDSVYGLNIGLYVTSLDTMYGLSVASIVSMADDVAGIQLSGMGNISKNASNGVLQVATMNLLKQEGEGVQIGFLNGAYDFTGVQIGAINCVEGNFSGVQIGLINVVKSSNIVALPILRVAF